LHACFTDGNILILWNLYHYINIYKYKKKLNSKIFIKLYPPAEKNITVGANVINSFTCVSGGWAVIEIRAVRAVRAVVTEAGFPCHASNQGPSSAVRAVRHSA
jgi:hypothetical protein